MSGAITAVAAVIGTAYTAYSGNQQTKSAKSAQNQARATADKQATAAEQAHNAANQKRPNTNSILDAASQSGRAGVSGTMLTGAQGVSKDQMALGRNTLLGQ